ncbi:MAG TPA: TolC family protein [Thermoanaerobaculia bacterium]|nr:TolC family protein [Thermoanaerobaculia bacterium]
MLFLFATMSMHDAVASAVAHSPELRALQAQVDQARAAAIMDDAFRPSASISASPGYASGLPTPVLGEVPAIATVEAHKIFYDTSAKAQQLGAEADVDAAQSRLADQRRQVAQSTAEVYARVEADRMRIADAQQRVSAYQTISSRVEALAKEGRARDIDVNRATLQGASAQRALLQAQSRLELDQLRLDRMAGEHVEVGAPSDGAPAGGAPAVGTPADGAPALAGPSPALAGPSPEAGPSPAEAGAPSLQRALANDPQLRSLDKRIATLQDMLGSERRLFKPTVAGQIQYSRLYDRYGRFYNNFKPDDFSAAATITLPVFTSGRRTAALARVNAQLQELTATRDARRTELEMSVREAETDYEQAVAERDLAERSLSVAQEGLRIAEQLSAEGRGEANDVPLAQIALAEAQDDVADATAHFAIARARLMIVRGDPI